MNDPTHHIQRALADGARHRAAALATHRQAMAELDAIEYELPPPPDTEAIEQAHAHALRTARLAQQRIHHEDHRS